MLKYFVDPGLRAQHFETCVTCQLQYNVIVTNLFQVLQWESFTTLVVIFAMALRALLINAVDNIIIIANRKSYKTSECLSFTYFHSDCIAFIAVYLTSKTSSMCYNTYMCTYKYIYTRTLVCACNFYTMYVLGYRKWAYAFY